MKNMKIGLVVIGLLSAVACGDSGGGDETGDTAGNTGGATAGTNATNTGDSAGTNGDNAGTNGAGTNGSNGSAGTNGSTNSDGSNTANTTAGDDDGGSTGSGGEGACTNDADVAALASFDPGATASGCGMQCLADDSCQTCYDNDANFSKVTPACRTCWVKITRCVADKCVLGGGAPCLTDAEGQACADCRSTNCDPDFTACSGMDPSMGM